MSFKTLSTTIALILAAGAATAQTVSAGDAQLAASAGVAPGLYTNAQLVQLIEAKRDGDASRVSFILSQAGQPDGGAIVSTSGGDSLSPVARETLLREAIRENDRQAIAFILSGESRAANPASVVTPGEAQLAAIAGVNPADFTLAELVALQPAKGQDN